MKKYNSLLKYLAGNWLLHENLFIFRNKDQQNKNNFITFNHYFKSYAYENKIYNQNRNKALTKNSKFNKKVNNYLFFKFLEKYEYNKIFFCLKYLRKGLFKASKYNIKKRIKQEEYIYIANKNILISILLIKSIQNQYLGAKISSYIRIKDN
uniref:Uncharacterized protein n=1 Tax=Vertebrata thuyoides TaxID=2006970 RepID=A0A1Z1MBF9_9FLOR|nr:hypothetical protein [Vertebrata thuyoides]ARW63094.1 hypothetical protein [Vertebrata thuyoides]